MINVLVLLGVIFFLVIGIIVRRLATIALAHTVRFFMEYGK